MRFVSPSRGFIYLYVAAFAGVFVSFIPFVTVLLPLKVAAVAKAGERVDLLSSAALSGAAVASIANLAFGALSDRTYRSGGTRRPWIAGGLSLLVLSYVFFLLAHDGTTLLCAVAALQIAINMTFAPLVAVMADEVPDGRKGMVSGLLGAAQPFASLVAIGVSIRSLGSEATRYGLLCLIMVALVSPMLLMIRERPRDLHVVLSPPARQRLDFASVWLARLLVQVAGNGLMTFGLFYFLSLPASRRMTLQLEERSESIAAIFAVVTILALLVTIAVGHLSDRCMRRKPFLAIASLVMASGLVIMACAESLMAAAVGFAMAICGMSVFLALQSALAMQLLPSPAHRGRDLGLVNLTNTLPAMAAPLLALALTPEQLGYAPWLITLAIGTLAGGGVAMAVRSQR
ncbi:MFS transporter [Sphingomonas sp. S2-65]|uniref:MFS transporter n=1 Tax=Sphingomonas sp. S2-65 TaxID=2903960 RepID=UPI001F18AB70|nr:MFS transporter [Sphingomonas sp. S2-65]UYY59724.1 MFS transporter [Sphingomonas sp. S2-65]